jgi:antirestriction protein ArdC
LKKHDLPRHSGNGNFNRSASYSVNQEVLKMDMYQQVTNSIIEQLEKGAIPWVKPWRADSSADRNLVSGKAYQGINRLLLGMSSMSQGFASPEWATYKQWNEKGAQVNKGEKATHIVFFKPMAGKKNAETGETEGGYCVIRGYAVFNATQTNYSAPVSDVPATQFNPIPACEQFIADTGALISHGGDAAFYAPSHDRIQLPNKSAFDCEGSYYATAFHELTHWTGSEKRLDRDLSKGRFGNPAYAFEELVAEIGEAFLCADYSIQGELRHAGYIANWLKACRDDSKAIFRASALAQKAADYLKACKATEIKQAA